MRKKVGILSLFYILLPIIIGYLCFESDKLYEILFDDFKWITIIVGLLYWFWVGRQFSVMFNSRLVNYLFGNSTTLVSLGIYLWSEEYISLSRDYVLLFRVSAREIFEYFRVDYFQTADLIIIGHIFMIMVFTLGYFTIQRNRETLF